MRKMAFVCALGAGTLAAQQDVIAVAGAPPQEATVAFLAVESGMVRPAGVVKNAPYTAEAESEFTQVLADGTRIQRKSSSKLARDSQGRTRSEHRNPGVGPMNLEIAPLVMIHDPVANETIALNEREKTARRMKLPELREAKPGDVVIERSLEAGVSHSASAGSGAGVVTERRVEIRRAAPGEPEAGTFEAELPPLPPMASAGNVVFYHSNQKGGKRESLGKQTISGLVCEGTRVTAEIPAGQIGNDRAIQIVTEEWYSPELQTMVMTRTQDPMHGETLYRLVNVKRGEPDKSLFEVPPGYTVKRDSAPMMIRKLDRKP